VTTLAARCRCFEEHGTRTRFCFRGWTVEGERRVMTPPARLADAAIIEEDAVAKLCIVTTGGTFYVETRQGDWMACAKESESLSASFSFHRSTSA
jgi:hypothetical protein